MAHIVKKSGKLIIVAAPSGTGKSTLIQHLMEQELNLSFSISATSRPPRGKEQNGVEYFFLSPEEFKKKIANGDFLEYCEVYENRFYGTLKSEVDKNLAEGRNVVLDLDVIGALRIKEIYGEQALALFILPPGIKVLRERLEGRGTDSQEVIEERIKRATYELTQAEKFDIQILNDKLDKAKKEIYQVVSSFLHE